MNNPVYHFDNKHKAEALFLKDNETIFELYKQPNVHFEGILSVGYYAVPDGDKYLIVPANDPHLKGVPQFRIEAANRMEARGIAPEQFKIEESADTVLDEYEIPDDSYEEEDYYEEYYDLTNN